MENYFCLVDTCIIFIIVYKNSVISANRLPISSLIQSIGFTYIALYKYFILKSSLKERKESAALKAKNSFLNPIFISRPV